MSEPITNMEYFNFAALAILDTLYECFPVPVLNFSPTYICAAKWPGGASEANVRTFDIMGTATLTWLAVEGFVRMGPAKDQGFSNVRLTLKGLAILGAVPTAVSGVSKPAPLIDRISGAVASGAKYAGQTVLKEIVGDLIRLGSTYAKDGMGA